MVKFDFNKTPITQIADYIILAAAKSNASDVHFDPRDDGMVVRFRIDGDLQNYAFIPKAYERNLSTRLKLLANMNITESRLPQDGAIKGEFGGVYLDMRVSSLPLNEGEKIVIRILDYSRSLEGLDQLGFNAENLTKLKRMIKVPNGIILITGATGSGKSTTVYSILQVLNKENTNIITVEDPIEMNIEGLNQVQVNSEIGMTFAAALRSILRQDPNVILIGEIRDSETAQIAVRSSITGHLVLSTIHTNSALSTVERLLDMNVERYLLSTALTGIISQRLAKKICPKCRIERNTTPYEKNLFQNYLNKNIDKIYDVNPKGCNECHNGYKGRIAIHEVLELDDEIRDAINDSTIKREELKELVYTDNVITMLQDALGKVAEGITNFDEVYRIMEIDDSESIFESKKKQKVEIKNQEINNIPTQIQESLNKTALIIPQIPTPISQTTDIKSKTINPINNIPTQNTTIPIANTAIENKPLNQINNVKEQQSVIPMAKTIKENTITNQVVNTINQNTKTNYITPTPNIVSNTPITNATTTTKVVSPIIQKQNLPQKNSEVKPVVVNQIQTTIKNENNKSNPIIEKKSIVDNYNWNQDKINQNNNTPDIPIIKNEKYPEIKIVPPNPIIKK